MAVYGIWANQLLSGLLLFFPSCFFLEGGDGLIPLPPRSLMVCSSVRNVNAGNKLTS